MPNPARSYWDRKDVPRIDDPAADERFNSPRLVRPSPPSVPPLGPPQRSGNSCTQDKRCDDACKSPRLSDSPCVKMVKRMRLPRREAAEVRTPQALQVSLGTIYDDNKAMMLMIQDLQQEVYTMRVGLEELFVKPMAEFHAMANRVFREVRDGLASDIESIVNLSLANGVDKSMKTLTKSETVSVTAAKAQDDVDDRLKVLPNELGKTLDRLTSMLESSDAKQDQILQKLDSVHEFQGISPDQNNDGILDVLKLDGDHDGVPGVMTLSSSDHEVDSFHSLKARMSYSRDVSEANLLRLVSGTVLDGEEKERAREMQCLLNCHADPNTIFASYRFKEHEIKSCSLLTAAVLQCNIAMVRLLVHHHADLESKHTIMEVGNLKKPWCGSVIHAVPATGSLAMLKELARLKADLHAVSSSRANVLWQCAYYGKKHMVKYLLEQGVPHHIAAQDADREGISYSPLHRAVLSGSNGIVDMLLEAKAQPTANEDGVDPLTDAIIGWFPKICRSLIQHGAELVGTSPGAGGIRMAGIEGKESSPENAKIKRTQSGRLHLRSDNSWRAGSNLELLEKTHNPVVWDFCAKGLRYQPEQVAGLSVNNIISFLKQPGDCKAEILEAVFSKGSLAFCHRGEVVSIRSAVIKQTVEIGTVQSYINVASTSSTYQEIQNLHTNRQEPDEELHNFFSKLVPTEKTYGFLLRHCKGLRTVHQVHSPVNCYRSCIPNFHRDIRTLKAIADCVEEELFDHHPCQAILGDIQSLTYLAMVFDLAIALSQLACLVCISYQTHYLCKGEQSMFLCTTSNLSIRVVSSIGLAFWIIGFSSEVLCFLFHAQRRWIRYYFRLNELMLSPTWVKLLTSVVNGFIHFSLVYDGDNADLVDSNHFRMVLSIGCIMKWWECVVFSIPLRSFGRNLMPVIKSCQDLVPLMVMLAIVCLAMVNFSIAINVEGSSSTSDAIEDRFTDMLFFGMTADFDSVDGVRDPKDKKVFLHYSLVVFTLFVPVILLNCTIAAMNNSYTLAFERAERHYLHYLARFSFQKAAMLQLLAQTFCLKSFWPQEDVYLWYCHAKKIDSND